MERERLLRDESAASDLLQWGRRHNDPFACALALARLEEDDDDSWLEIIALAEQCSPEEFQTLDEALEAWSDDAREISSEWDGEELSEHGVRLARAFNLHKFTKKVRLDVVVRLERLRVLSLKPSRFRGLHGAAPRPGRGAPRPDCAQIVSQAHGMRGLRRLSLRNNGIGDEGAIALAQSPYLNTLHTLALGENAIGEEGACALAASRILSGLEHLDLGNNTIGDVGAQALSESQGGGSLITLHLQNNNIGTEGASALAQSQHLKHLKVLFLYGNPIGAQGAAALARATHLSHLETLYLDLSDVGEDGARALAGSQCLSQRVRERFSRFIQAKR